MRTRRTPPWRASALLLLLGGCVVVSAPPPAASRAPSAEIEDLELQIHQRVNRFRAGQGLPALQRHAGLAEIARAHSAAMASRQRPFGHAGMEERVARVRERLVVRSLAENVAYNNRTGAALVESVVSGWIQSAGHRANLVGPYQLAGVGVARAGSGPYYVTQIYVQQP